MAILGQCYYRFCETRVGHRLAQWTLDGARSCGRLREFKMPLDCLSLPHVAVRELMRLWRRQPWSGGDGMMTHSERLAVYTLAAQCQADGDLVELGAWKGLTTCYLAAACRARGKGKSQVFAVDTFEGTREYGTQYESIPNYGGTTLPAFRESIGHARVSDVVTPYVGYTTEMAKRHRGRPVAFLLIDADHSYEGAKADFEAWFPLVAEGGIVAFHDYAMPEAGVAAFVDGEAARRDDVRSVLHGLPPNIFAVVKTTSPH